MSRDVKVVASKISKLGTFRNSCMVYLKFTSFDYSLLVEFVIGSFLSVSIFFSPGNYGIHLRTKIIENKRQFDVQKLD